MEQLQQRDSKELRITANFGKVSEPKAPENKMSICSPQESKLCSPTRRSFVSEDTQDNFRYTFFPKDEDDKIVKEPQNMPNYRLPKIVINKKNFVFKDAIEQIRKDRQRRSRSRKRCLRASREREVFSEEARDTNG